MHHRHRFYDGWDDNGSRKEIRSIRPLSPESGWNLQTSAVSSSLSSSHYMHEIHFWYWNIDRCRFLRLHDIAAGRVLWLQANIIGCPAITFLLSKSHKTGWFVSSAARQWRTNLRDAWPHAQTRWAINCCCMQGGDWKKNLLPIFPNWHARMLPLNSPQNSIIQKQE